MALTDNEIREYKKTIPHIVDCHCMADAHKYTVKTYVNKMGHTVFKAFYRCINCCSRVHRDYIPEFDAIPKVDVMDLLRQHKENA